MYRNEHYKRINIKYGSMYGIAKHLMREREIYFKSWHRLHIQLQVEVFSPDLWSIHGQYWSSSCSSADWNLVFFLLGRASRFQITIVGTNSTEHNGVLIDSQDSQNTLFYREICRFCPTGIMICHCRWIFCFQYIRSTAFFSYISKKRNFRRKHL